MLTGESPAALGGPLLTPWQQLGGCWGGFGDAHHTHTQPRARGSEAGSCPGAAAEQNICLLLLWVVYNILMLFFFFFCNILFKEPGDPLVRRAVEV